MFLFFWELVGLGVLLLGIGVVLGGCCVELDLVVFWRYCEELVFLREGVGLIEGEELGVLVLFVGVLEKKLRMFCCLFVDGVCFCFLVVDGVFVGVWVVVLFFILVVGCIDGWWMGWMMVEYNRWREEYYREGESR